MSAKEPPQKGKVSPCKVQDGCCRRSLDLHLLSVSPRPVSLSQLIRKIETSASHLAMMLYPVCREAWSSIVTSRRAPCGNLGGKYRGEQMSVFIHSRPCPSIWPYWQCFLPGPKATQGSRGEGKERGREERGTGPGWMKILWRFEMAPHDVVSEIRNGLVDVYYQCNIVSLATTLFLDTAAVCGD